MLSMSIVQIAVRSAQFALAIIVMGLSAFVANWYNMDTLTSSPTQINFLIAVPLFSLASIAYLELLSRFAPRAFHPIPAIAFEVLNALFYFAGFIALAVFLSQLLFCRGNVCGSARAATFFGAVLSGLWSATAFLQVQAFMKGGVRKNTVASQMREKEASMA